MGYYLKVYMAFIKNTFAREGDYRANVLAEIIDSLLNFFVNITFFEVLYMNVESIAGWSSTEILVLVGVCQLIISVIYMLFMNNLPRIQRYIFNGDFDYIALKPCDEQFYVSFRYFYFGGIPNFCFSIGLIIYGLIKLNRNISIVNILGFIPLVLCGIIICYSIWFIIMSSSIIFLKVGKFMNCS